MGLKKADPSRLKDLLPKKDRSLDPEVIKSHIQKLRSFRYQMKTTLAGDNLDTLDELTQKGVLANGELSMSLEHHRNGSISLARGLSENGEGVSVDTCGLPEALELPREFASVLERVDGPQMKRSVELMGQCVQVQRSAHGVLLKAIEAQEALKAAIMDKVREMGLPSVSDMSSITDMCGSGAAHMSGGSGKHSMGLLNAGGGNITSNFLTESPSLSAAAAAAFLSPRTGNGGMDTFSGFRGVNAVPRLPRVSSGGAGSGSEGGGGGGDVKAQTARSTGLGTYAGVASMLQASAQSMQLSAPPPLNKSGMPPGSANLFSFVPTANSNSNHNSNNNTPATSATAASAGTEAAAAVATSTLHAGSGSAAAAETSALTSVLASGAGAGVFSGSGGGSPRETGLSGTGLAGLGLESVDYWDMGILDTGGAGGAGMAGLDALDETSLRMEMKSSMDMHRLMRSRQKNQLQLHAQQEQRQRQESAGDSSEASKARTGDVGGTNISSDSIKSSSSSAKTGAAHGNTFKGGDVLEGMSASRAAAAGSGATTGSINANTDRRLGGAGVAAGVGGSDSLARQGDAPPPAPPPRAAPGAGGARGGGSESLTAAAAAAAAGVGVGSNRFKGVARDAMASLRSDMVVAPTGDTPTVINGEFNWDEDTMDEQLFSFLLDTPPPG